MEGIAPLYKQRCVWSSHAHSEDPIPVMEPGLKRQQRFKSSCAEHLKTPPPMASNIAASQGRPQQQRRVTKEPGSEKP